MSRLEALLTNQDFWAALVTLLTAILVGINVPQGSVTQIAAIVSATGAFIAFVLGKSAVQIAQFKLKTARIENETAQLKAGK